MNIEKDVQVALDELSVAPTGLVEALTAAAQARTIVMAARFELDEAKRRLDAAVVHATAEAMFGAGATVDGKNAETRKAQLDLYLLTSPAVASAQAGVEQAEAALLDANTQVELREAEARAATIRTSLAHQRAALLAGYCQILGSPLRRELSAAPTQTSDDLLMRPKPGAMYQLS